MEEAKAPRLKGYPKESFVSEKFHAMIRHAQLNSRFKDYYDVWLIAENFTLEAQSLQKAIEKTFEKRKTEIPVERPIGLTIAFAKENQSRWSRFLGKLHLQNESVEDFVKVIESIWLFLEHPVHASTSKIKSNRHWTPTRGWE